MTAKFAIDINAIRQLADILGDTGLAEIEYEDGGRRIRVSRGSNIQAATVVSAETRLPSGISQVQTMAQSLAAPSGATMAGATAAGDHPGSVKSPMVGTAYLCPEPGAAAFVKVGDTLNQGQTLMIIEAMKVMNPIKAPRAGKLTAIFVQDASPVEFGEPLMIIE